MKIFSIHLFYFLFIFLTKFFPFLTKAVMIVIIVTYIISAIFYITTTITDIIIGTAPLRMISIIIANYNTMFIVVFMYIMLLIIITS